MIILGHYIFSRGSFYKQRFIISVNYTLKNKNGLLGRISLYKASYKLGEDVTGTVDLTTATIACLQVTMV